MFSLFRNSKCKVTNFYRNVSITLLCISGLIFPCYPHYGIVPLLSSVVFFGFGDDCELVNVEVMVVRRKEKSKIRILKYTW